jgi:hypothetical protein
MIDVVRGYRERRLPALAEAAAVEAAHIEPRLACLFQ